MADANRTLFDTTEVLVPVKCLHESKPSVSHFCLSRCYGLLNCRKTP